MSTVLQLAIALGVIFLLIKLLPLVLLWLAVLKMELRAHGAGTIDAEKVPEDLRRFLELGAQQIRPLGFQPVAWITHRAIDEAPDAPARVSLLLHHPEKNVWARVGVAPMGDRDEPFSISYRARFADGTSLVGLNGQEWAVVGCPPRTEMLDPYAETLEGAWHAFETRKQSIERERGAQALSVEALLASDRDETGALLADLEAKGAIVRGDDGAFVFRTRAAFALALRMATEAPRYRALVASRKKRALEPIPVPLQVEIDRYARVEAARTRKTKRQRYGVIFLLTGAAFGLSMLHLFDAITILAIVAILFFHELGHFVMMRLFGYTDTTIFFVPFFGAATIGRKDNPSLSTELFVLFGGPIPGLALGLLLFALFPELKDHDSARIAVMMLIAINWVNLLPFYPLDGGKITEALFFARAPVAAVVFRGIAAVAFLAAGLLPGGWVFIVVGMLGLIALRTGFRTVRLERDIVDHKKRVADAGPDLHLIFERLVALGYDKLPMSTRYALVRSVERTFKRPPVGLFGRTLGFGVYGATIVGSSLFALSSIAGNKDMQIACGGRIEREVRRLAVPRDHSVHLTCNVLAPHATDRLQEDLVLAAFGREPPPWRIDEPRSVSNATTFTYREVESARRKLMQAHLSPREAGIMDAVGDVRSDPRFDTKFAHELLTSSVALELLRARLGGTPANENATSTTISFSDGIWSVQILDDQPDLLRAAEHLCANGCESLDIMHWGRHPSGR
jgi:hypothetical protein